MSYYQDIEHHASYVILDITDRIAAAIRHHKMEEAQDLVHCLKMLRRLFPEAKAEVDARYPIEKEKDQ